MRGTWVLGAAALALTAGAFLYTTNKPSGARAEQPIAEPTASEFVQAAQQQQAFVPKGFDNRQAARVEEIHAHVVATLDDLDAANGIRRIKTADGERVIKVSPRFGESRMEVLISHNGEIYATGTKRPGSGTSDPFLMIASAHGKPLTAASLDWQKPGEMEIQQGVPVDRSSPEESKRSLERFYESMSDRIEALRKVVARANLGLDSGFETDTVYGWAKPLKLTKNECLPCHQGMKVGDTVGIIAYMHGK
jgi:hypothetical protein